MSGALVLLHADSLACEEVQPAGMHPPARYSHAASVVGYLMVLHGGKAADNTPLADIHVLSLRTNTWSQPYGGRLQGPARHCHSLCTIQVRVAPLERQWPTQKHLQTRSYLPYEGTARQMPALRWPHSRPFSRA